MYFASLTDQVISMAFSRWWLQHQKWRNTYPGRRKRKLLFEIDKKGKLNTKRLSKVTILDEQEPSVQPADRTIAVQV